MKTLLETEDIQAIASTVVEMLKPLLASNGKHEAGEDIVFDKKGLAEYLKVSPSTVDKMVRNREIPFFKLQPGQSGSVRFHKSDIDKWRRRHTSPAIDPVQKIRR